MRTMPRSCPHRPGLPMSTLIFRPESCMRPSIIGRFEIFPEDIAEYAADFAYCRVSAHRFDQRRHQVVRRACRPFGHLPQMRKGTPDRVVVAFASELL